MTMFFVWCVTYTACHLDYTQPRDCSGIVECHDSDQPGEFHQHHRHVCLPPLEWSSGLKLKFRQFPHHTKQGRWMASLITVMIFHYAMLLCSCTIIAQSSKSSHEVPYLLRASFLTNCTKRFALCNVEVDKWKRWPTDWHYGAFSWMCSRPSSCEKCK